MVQNMLKDQNDANDSKCRLGNGQVINLLTFKKRN